MIMFFLIHYFYSVFLADTFVIMSNQLINFSDSLGINMHFIRFVHMSFFGDDTDTL